VKLGELFNMQKELDKHIENEHQKQINEDRLSKKIRVLKHQGDRLD
jgi:uncharacterized C2H2 Zn-finger protein